MSIIMNFLTGAGVKILSHFIGRMIELKRERDLASLSADTDRLVKLQGGTDTSDESTRWTRRILALLFSGCWCFIVVYLVLHPTIEYKIMIGKSPSIIFGWLFDTTDKTTLHLSAGSLLWDFKGMMEILIGFYFTKIGK